MILPQGGTVERLSFAMKFSLPRRLFDILKVLIETDKTLTRTCFFRIIKVNRCLKNKSGITGFWGTGREKEYEKIRSGTL